MFPYWVNYFRNKLGTELSYSIIWSKMMCVHQRQPVWYTETTDTLFEEVEYRTVWTYVVHMMCRSIEHTWLCWYWIIYFVIHYLLEASWKHVIHGAIKDEYIHNPTPQQYWVTKLLSLTPYNTSIPCPPCICSSHYTSPSRAAKNIAKLHIVIVVISLRIPEDEAEAEDAHYSKYICTMIT